MTRGQRRPQTPPGGDVEVYRVLSSVGLACARIEADLAALHDLLAHGAGQPNAGELTPDEYQYLSHVLARVGLRGTRFLVADADRTNARESHPPAPPSRPH